jgi:hypothetical protein
VQSSPPQTDGVANATCVACGYLLTGLAAGGVCPECATPIRASLHPDPFGFFGSDDLRRLARGVERLQRACRTLLATLGVLIATIVLGAVLPPVLIAGIPLLIIMIIAGLASWILGWLDVARLRTPGADMSLSEATLRCSAVAQAILIALVPFTVVVRAGVLFAILDLLALLAAITTIGAGQARLVALARRGRSEQLARAGADSSRLVYFAISITLAALIFGLGVNAGVGALLAFGAALTWLAAGSAWYAFLGGVTEAADRRS